MWIVFDVVGTLFSLSKIKNRFRDEGIRQDLMELWFARLLQSVMASTLAGKYIPFKVLAQFSLKQVFAQENIDERHLDAVLNSLREIEPWEDTGECLRALRSDGHRLIALTNSGIDDAGRLLERSGLKKEFENVYSADDAGACKPHPAPYNMVLKHAGLGPSAFCMVAAHGWDVLGAQSVGMNTIYITRLEKQWPFPGSPSDHVVSTLREVPGVISRQFTKWTPLIEEAG